MEINGRKGKVYLVGAGCGSADLITVRGLELLKGCDAVVYDDLIQRELLDAAPAEAERIFMGKRLGNHSAEQNAINAKLVELGQKGMRIVRLKGGDPFVFGRISEEIDALTEAGIDYETVPGISSCIAIPSEAGIPVTYRGVSRGFHVITAHTKDSEKELPSELERLAGTDGTIVILMGLSKIRLIAECLIGKGMSPDTPAAVISGGNSEYPAAVRSALSDIAEKTEKEGVRSPAVIIIGNTAAYDLQKGGYRPLKGKIIGITGTDSIQKKLRPALAELGAEVFLAERSVIKELEPPEEAFTEICNGKPHWIVFTSSAGVDAFFRLTKKNGTDLRRLAQCRFAVIGGMTGARLKEYCITADLCPETYTGKGLAEAMLRQEEDIPDVCIFRSARGSRLIAEMLRSRYSVRDIPVYDLKMDEDVRDKAVKLLPKADYLTFSSGSGVEFFYSLYGIIPENAKCVCIGEVTAEALRKRYSGKFIVSPEISAEGIVKAITEAEEAERADTVKSQDADKY